MSEDINEMILGAMISQFYIFTDIHTVKIFDVNVEFFWENTIFNASSLLS